MKGLIYKNLTVFFKDMDKKLVLIAGGTILLLLIKTGVYAGLLASIMLAMTTGMQNINGFASDEKADWKKYQMAMPISAFSVVAGKYLAVICTVAASLGGSILLNLIASMAFGIWDPVVWEVSLVVSVLIPLLWTGICLPFTYWFGYQTAQTMGLFVVFPLVYLIKYFEDGPGFFVMSDSVLSYAAAAGAVTAVLFLISMVISAAGCGRRK